ncbi:MAG: DUF4147 domain-containing protein, partial [Caldithrix sp.]|nr:DUF4147 domain-containing protein [Caldithrix sp.]
MELSEQALHIFESALDRVRPQRLIQDNLTQQGGTLYIRDRHFDLDAYDNIYVIGAGKASAYMARAVEEILGPRVTTGMVNVKYGHGADCKRISVNEAGHPILDQAGLNGTSRMLSLVQQCKEDDLVICLLSGGGSALLEKLPPAIDLQHLQQTTAHLLECGADIAEINTIRKHLSMVKGGQLAKAIAPATCVTLIISDVIGDPLHSIASGPTAADESTFSQAWRVVEKYALEPKLPKSVTDHLQNGMDGHIQETLKAGDSVLDKVYNWIIGNNRLALQAASQKAEELGLHAISVTDRLSGEAREKARDVVQYMIELRKQGAEKGTLCVLYGGETTVK